MEFRSCPACKASVLEDDVDECPFCGASMSGKPKAPSAKKPAVEKAAPSQPQSKSAPTVQTGKAAQSGKAASTSARPDKRSSAPSSSPEAAGKDDPFEVDTSALRRAVKLSPRPTKSRTLEVVCPMCETHGFMPPAEAGKDVHCCNSDCLVPVFKTERPRVEEVPVEEPKSNRWLMIGGSVTALAIVGACVWIFILAPEKKEVVIDVPDVVPDTPLEDLHLTPENRVVRNVEAPPATLSEIRQRSLENIAERARQRDRNRSVEYATQLAAESFAEAGKLKQAQDLIRRLQSISGQAPYFQIQPLVETGWQQLAAGQLKEAQRSAATAQGKSKNLPHSVRKTLDAVSSLAALYVALDETDKAQELVRKEQDTGPRGQLSSMWRAAIDSHTFQLDQEARRPWHLAVPEPMRMAVVESLVAHGHPEKGLQFAELAQDAASVSACRAAWAGRLAQMEPQQVLDQVTSALQAAKASPASQCQAWAAVAAMAFSRNEKELAQSALEKAVVASTEIQAPVSVALPKLKEIHDSAGKAHVGLPNPAPSHAGSLALANLAIAQLNTGERDSAWKSFQKALEYATGMAPSPAATQQLLDECQNQELALRSQLNQALNLNNNPQEIRTAFNRYRNQCGKLHVEAQQRLQLQVAILRFAAAEGLLEETWSYARDRSQANDLKNREPYRETTLPGFIQSLAEAAGNQKLVNAVNAASPEKPVIVDPIDAIYAEADAAITNNDFPRASDAIERGYRSSLARKQPDRLDELALRFCSRAEQKAAPAQMIPFIKNLYDEIVQEDAFLLMAGNSMQRGTGPELWKVAAASRDLATLDHVALYRGFIASHPKDSPAQPSPPNAENAMETK